ncbi:hypothetical protein HK104_000185 [Borealophlyctis nickersoniae]|nr:hypothetical protein HK104_000185 [Borealophlyctis nickersoniae]
MSMQDKPFNLLAPARIRVLLVPVHPIRRETFRFYADVISQLNVVALQDLTPDVAKTQSKFTEQLYHEGYLYFNHVTSFNREHAPLEEMQLHRQILGVIGIMHCEQVPSISEGYKRYQSILNRYPSAIASRCFAFEPSELHTDDTKGCIMIPNDPNKLLFYLSTQINDFASEMLSGFGDLASNFEKRSMISGPVMLSPLLTQPNVQAGGSFTPSLATASTSPSASSLAATPSAASLYSNSSATSPTGGTFAPPPSRDPSSPALLSQDSTASMLGFGLGQLLSPDKTKKRTPARVQKLLGDLYLMAGRVDLAINNYLTAIDMMKGNSDYQWQAAATENYICALILSYLKKAGAGPRWDGSTDNLASPDADRPGRHILVIPTVDTVFDTASSYPQLRSLFCDIPDKYRDIISLYERAFQSGQPGFYPVLQIQACLEIAQFLASMWLTRFTGAVINGAGILLVAQESKGIADIASTITRGGGGSGVAGSGGTVGGGGTTLDRDRIVLNGGLGATRADASSWIMRAWSSGMEYLSVSDQVWCVTRIASVYGQLGYARKHAFFLRQVNLLVLATLKVLDGRSMSSVAENDVRKLRAVVEESEDGGEKKRKEKTSNGALECMKRVCEALGVGEPDGGVEAEEDDWMDDYQDDADLDVNDTLEVSSTSHRKVHLPRLRFGWPDLQIDVLKECINMAEIVDDHGSAIMFTARLLRRLHKYLTRSEQANLSATMQAVVLQAQGRSGEEIASSKSDQNSQQAILVRAAAGTVMGVPLLRRFEVTPRKVPIPHLRTAKALEVSDDPFLYNPFANKGANKKGKRDPGAEVILVANEPAFFEVILANPFAFDLDIQSITVNTSGIPFKPTPVSTTIPAESRCHIVRLSGTPSDSGTLHIHGCTVRMFGGCVEEIIQPIKTGEISDARKKTKDGKRIRQDDRERYGKKAIEFSGGRARAATVSTVASDYGKPWSISLKVIPEQPILQVNNSLTSPGSMMLFEGERTTFKLTLENIGTTHIDHLTIAFLESYATDLGSVAPTGAETMEDVYERDVYEKSIRALWLHSDVGGHPRGEHQVESMQVDLAPGGKMDLVIGVFGKRRSTGGMITLEYGHVALPDSTSAEGSEDVASPPDPHFYTRRLLVPVLLTVHRALEALNMDVLLFPRSSPRSSEEKSELLRDGGRNLSVEEMMVDPFAEGGRNAAEAVVRNVPPEKAREYCLFTFDLRNEWGHPFEVSFDIYDDPNNDSPSETSTTIIHAGVTKRIILPLSRLSLPKSTSTAPIPTPDWKQFVVGKVRKGTAEEVAVRRAMFWYKEALVGGHALGRGRLVARWCYSKDRKGVMPLRSLHLTRGMLTQLKKEDISFSVRVADSNGEDPDPTAVRIAGIGRFRCKIGECVSVEWTVVNRKEIPVKLCLRILPTQDIDSSAPDPTFVDADSPTLHALHADAHNNNRPRGVMWSGSLQTCLEELSPGGSARYAVPVVFLSKGRFRFLAHVEHIGLEVGNDAGEREYWDGDGVVVDAVDEV